MEKPRQCTVPAALVTRRWTPVRAYAGLVTLLREPTRTFRARAGLAALLHGRTRTCAALIQLQRAGLDTLLRGHTRTLAAPIQLQGTAHSLRSKVEKALRPSTTFVKLRCCGAGLGPD